MVIRQEVNREKRSEHIAEAELLYQQALSIYERQLGVDHPRMATNLNNLALLYQNQKKYAEAELLLKRALAINEQE